jgi:site-specific DNA recombinase
MKRKKKQETKGFNDPNAAVVYIRVSDDRQVDNTSLDGQERACKDFCHNHGWKVTKLFREEGESAKTAERPRLMEMLRYCKAATPRPSFVVFYAVDRFARSAHDHQVVKRHLASVGVLLRSATQPLGESPADALMEGMLSHFAQFDNAVRAERSSNGMKARLNSGSWPFKAPIGYLNATTATGKTLVPDPDRAPHVREAFSRFATGLYTKGQVRERVTVAGLRTRRSGAKVSAETFRRLLENPIYTGVLTVGAWEGEHAASFDPLVDRETFNRVQHILKGLRPQLIPNQRNHPGFPLRAFVRCGGCNRPVTAGYSTGRHSVKYGYYRCQNDACPLKLSERREDMHEQFLDFVSTLTPKPELVKMFRETVESYWVERYREVDARLSKLQEMVSELRKRRTKLYQAHIDDKVPTDVFLELKAELDAETMKAEFKIDSARMDEIKVDEVLEFCERVLCNVPMLWKECNLDQQQRLQQVLFPQGVLYDHKTGYRTAATCLFFSMLEGNLEDKTHLVALTGIEPVSQP